MLPASLAADVPVFIATPTSAWARAGASLVPSPVIATSWPPSCSFLISASLSSGVASARKSSTPASSAIALAVSGLSPVIITVRMPIRRISSNRSRMPCLDDVLEVDDAEHPGRLAVDALGDHQRGAAGGGDAVDDLADLRRYGWPPFSRTHFITAVAAPLRTCRAGRPSSARSTPDIRVWAVNGTHVGVRPARPGCRSRSPYAAWRDHDRAALGRLVGQAGQLRGVGQLRSASTPATGRNSRGLPVAEGDRAGLVQQQRVDVAGRLDRPAGHGQHVALHQPVHAGDADRRQQRADRGRDQADQQRDQHDAGDAVAGRARAMSGDAGLLRLGEDRQRLQGGDGEQEDDRQRGEQDVQRDLVRRLLPVGALDQGDHPVDEALARLLGDLHDDPVGEHLGAAGDRASGRRRTRGSPARTRR